MEPNPAVDVTCRYCGTHGRVHVEIRLDAKPLGTWSLAGAQEKTVAYEWPYAVCGACGHVSRGRPAPDSAPPAP